MYKCPHGKSLSPYFQPFGFTKLENTVGGFIHVFDNIITIGNDLVHPRPNSVDYRQDIGIFVLAIIHLLVGIIQILPYIKLS